MTMTKDDQKKLQRILKDVTRMRSILQKIKKHNRIALLATEHGKPRQLWRIMATMQHHVAVLYTIYDELLTEMNVDALRNYQRSSLRRIAQILIDDIQWMIESQYDAIHLVTDTVFCDPWSDAVSKELIDMYNAHADTIKYILSRLNKVKAKAAFQLRIIGDE